VLPAFQPSRTTSGRYDFLAFRYLNGRSGIAIIANREIHEHESKRDEDIAEDYDGCRNI